MSSRPGVGIRSTEHFLVGNDLATLTSVLDAARSLRIPVGRIEPESATRKKRMFGRPGIVPTGYAASISIGVGDQHDANRPLALHLMFERPQGSAGLTAAQASRLFASGTRVPPALRFTDDFGPDVVHLDSEDIRPVPTVELAALVFEGLMLLGATLPTGRWRCLWHTSRRDPRLPV